jgi:phosphoribosylaminoimidazolecarboxamide formyltransferase/IMP cyclohydrolase
MWKRALVSVSNKSGLVEFLKPLASNGLEIVSTGGTAEYLRQAGMKVTDVSQVTEFPEVLDGRVKTLNPRIHMGLLGRPDEPKHVQTMKEHSVQFFDLVVVNLYPFEEAFHSGKQGRELIEKIDVGGPSMLRAAAKNFEFITVLVDPSDYGKVVNEGKNLEFRKHLASKVFAHLSAYDSLIAQALGSSNVRTWAAEEVQTLRYGENPHQQATWYRRRDTKHGLQNAQILQGKELSYNNLLDLDAAMALCCRFTQPAVVAVKHNNPCGVAQELTSGVAQEKDILQATVKAMTSDPVSVFGGIVAVNRPVTAAVAEELNKVFLECVIAPDFDDAAMKVFEKKKNLRLLKLNPFTYTQKEELRGVLGGFLTQTTDQGSSDPSAWKFIGKTPNDSIKSDLEFGEKVCAALKSNAIAVVGQGQTFGLGMGQVNRVDAVRQALERYQKFHAGKEAVLISDAFFPFSDSIDEIAKAGIKWVLQPGGSMRDEEVFKRSEELGVNLVVTGQRHFKH